MTEPDVDEVVRRAEEVSATRLRAVLESEHVDQFVAIEPEPAIISWAKTPSEAIVD